ncbi:MAG: hypothetical protein IKY25_06725 [Alistipes sp.]|nr:hypothetical protein [Alistipes sp.]
MKRLFAILINLVLIVSCSTSNDTTTDSVEYVNVSLTPKIDYSIEPLSRADITDKDYIFVQIAMLDGSNMYSGWQSEQNGFFTKEHEIKFKLVRGAYYLIKAIVVKDMVGRFGASELFDPQKVNSFYGEPLIVLTGRSYTIDGKGVSWYPLDNYIGGIFFQAKEDIDINLDMIHNVYGVTVNLTGDTDGELYVCSNKGIIVDGDPSFHKTDSGETLKFMYDGDIFGTIDWLTTGDTITHEEAFASVDVYFKYITSEGEDYELSKITVPNVKRGQNIIFNINTDDFIPAEGTVNFNIMGDGELEDTVYE